VCAAFIVKDRSSFNYLSGGLMVKGFESKASPANKLHYKIVKDCFYEEDKEVYNISYSGPESPVYRFKSSFRPVEKIKPKYYTYLIRKKLTGLIYNLQKKKLISFKKALRKIIKRFS
jgi:hypothetical protein